MNEMSEHVGGTELEAQLVHAICFRMDVIQTFTFTRPPHGWKPVPGTHDVVPKSWLLTAMNQ